MVNSTAQCIIEANPDVSGTGIRASIYALCLGGTVASYFLRVLAPSEDGDEFSRSVSSALGMQGLALLCTAIYQTIRNDLTLFHAICVVHLLALLGLDLISKGRYTGLGPWRLWCFAVIQILSLVAFIAFNVYLWVTAPTFGSQPVCNDNTIYVVFGVSIKATSPVFRYVILGTLGAGALSYLLTFACIIPCVCGIWRKTARESEIPGMQARKRDWVRSLFRWSQNTESQSEVIPTRLSGEVLLNFTLNKAAYCGLCIYLIVSLEQTIQRNNLDPQEKGWTFGQVIAIFLLLGVANELLNVVLANWDRKIGRTGQELVPFRPADQHLLTAIQRSQSVD